MPEAGPRLGFIGAGRVGGGLAAAFSQLGCQVGTAGRNAHEQASVVAAADIVFLTVPDDAIAELCGSLPWRAGQAAVHCSGACDLAVLAAARRRGAAVGGFHPLHMFLAGERPELRGCAVAIEAEGELHARLLALVERLGARPLRIPPGGRAAYHAAAHYAGPFIAAGLAEACAIWERLGIAPADALAALLPLARGSLDTIGRAGPAGAMAGSVARGDVGTIARHLEALGAMGDGSRELYRQLALRSVPLGEAQGRLPADRVAAMRQVLR